MAISRDVTTDMSMGAPVLHNGYYGDGGKPYTFICIDPSNEDKVILTHKPGAFSAWRVNVTPAPTKIYVPWVIASLPEFPIVVRDKTRGVVRLALTAYKDGVTLGGVDGLMRFEQLFEEYEYLPDGLKTQNPVPCGSVLK